MELLAFDGRKDLGDLLAIGAMYENFAASTMTEMKDKANEMKPHMLTEQEVAAFREMLDLLRPAAAFTQCSGTATKPTVSQIYRRVYELLPPIDNV